MPVSDENLPLYRALQRKSDALFDYVMELNNSKTPANAFFVDIQLDKARFELERLDAVMSALDNNSPVNFPSQDQFNQLRASVEALQNAIAAGAAFEGLVQAGSAVIAAWPVSSGG